MRGSDKRIEGAKHWKKFLIISKITLRNRYKVVFELKQNGEMTFSKLVEPVEVILFLNSGNNERF